METDPVEPHATALADAIEGALAGWVQRCVRDAVVAAGVDPARLDPSELAELDRGAVAAGVDPARLDPSELAELAERARKAGEEARDDLGPRIRALLEQDIDTQASNPLQLLRGAVRYPTDVLLAAGISAPERDADQQRLLPDDPYDLTPARFADIDPALADPGVAWGAAKAYEHLRRRARAGAEARAGADTGREFTSEGDDE